MNPGGINPKQIRDNIIELMLELKRKRQEKGIIDPIELCFALHIIADSYARTHAQRDNRDRIVKYNNYKEQDASIDHAPYDGFNDEAFKNMSKKEIGNLPSVFDV